jgi:hypothetical protein
MHIQVINYQKTFNLGNYSSERIGVEIAVNAGEDAKEALATARQLVEEYHKESLKPILQQAYGQQQVYEEPVEVIKTQSPRTVAEKTKVFIDACKTAAELKAWELMCKNKPELETYYKKKLKSLK